MSKSKSKPNVDIWLERMTPDQWHALDNASKNFPKGSPYNFYTLEGMYGLESQFGRKRGKRNSARAAVGDFQIKKDVATKLYGLKVSKDLDERFDINKAADCAAKYLNSLDSSFSKRTNVRLGYKTISISDSQEAQEYPDKVQNYAKEFQKKSQPDGTPLGMRWITKDGRHLLIRID